MELFFPPFFFLLFFVLAIGEYILSAFWVPFYFQFGIPLYRQSYRLPDMPPDLGSHIPTLEAQLTSSWGRGAIVFRALGSHELAFRQNLIKNSRNAVHGRVLVDSLHQQVTITGYFYWTLLLFPLLFLTAGFMDFTVLPFFAFLLLIILISIIQQRKSYGRVATAIQKTLHATSGLGDAPEFTPYDPLTSSPSRLPGLSTTELVLVVVLLMMLLMTGAVFTMYWFSR